MSNVTHLDGTPYEPEDDETDLYLDTVRGRIPLEPQPVVVRVILPDPPPPPAPTVGGIVASVIFGALIGWIVIAVVT